MESVPKSASFLIFPNQVSFLLNLLLNLLRFSFCDRIQRFFEAFDDRLAGIMFQDITTLLLDPKAFKDAIDMFVERYKGKNISVVAGNGNRFIPCLYTTSLILLQFLVWIRINLGVRGESFTIRSDAMVVVCVNNALLMMNTVVVCNFERLREKINGVCASDEIRFAWDMNMMVVAH